MLEKFTFGQQIKYVRTIKKINQNELAKGICSISYLSKIENGVIYPSEEIKNLLIKKLGIEDSTLNNEFGEREIQGFYNFLLNKDIQNAEKVYKELLNKDFSEALNLRFEVISIFYFVERKQFKELPQLIQSIFSKEAQLPSELRYFFYKALGYYYYHTQKAEKSLYFFEKSVSLVTMFTLNNLEIADLYYAYSLAAARLKKTAICLKYCQSALEIYQELYLLKRCVDCHVLLGITHRRNNNMEEAISQYKTALDLAGQIHYKDISLTIQHNLGFLYGVIGELDKAIDLFQEILSKEDQLTPYVHVQTILSLVKELHKRNNNKEAFQLVQKGFELLIKHPDLKNQFYLEFNFYNLLLLDKYEELQKLLFSKVVPALEMEKKYFSLSNYCLFLGDHHYANGKYKNAAKYFAYSREFLNKSNLTK